ncbi:hypothetical protein A0257_16875 [Hymenobacter psoromatis]|nr:hypothetical protein A0257_16875 [Hymenobacter psoromatis]
MRALLPAAALAAGPPPLAWLGTRADALRLDLGQLARTQSNASPTPGLVLNGAEVDGEARPATGLGELPASRHRISFALQGISLAPGARRAGSIATACAAWLRSGAASARPARCSLWASCRATTC